MRITVPTGGSIKLFATNGRRIGFSIQNVSAVDIYYSDDQRQLDNATAANLPTVGHLLAASTPASPPTVYPAFVGALYARAQSPAAQLEVLPFEIDPPC